MDSKAVTEIRKRRDEAALIMHEMDALLDLLGANDAPAEVDETEEGDEQDEPADATPPPPSAPKAGARGARADGALTAGRRLQAARLIAETGPIQATAICRRVGLSPSGFRETVRGHPWFRKVGDELRSPYDLTDAGREAVKQAAAG